MSIVVGGKLQNVLNQITVLLVIFVNGLRGEECGVEALDKCAAPLTLISSIHGLSAVTQKQELDEVLCPQLYGGMICIRSYTRRCMSLGQRGHFLKLFHGPQQVVRELCKEGPLQNEYLRHTKCLQTISDQYENCAVRYHDALLQAQSQNKAENNETYNLVCCSFQEYVDCSERAALDKCGTSTALFARKFMNQMTLPMINEYCRKSSEEGHECEYKKSGATFDRKMSLPCAILIWVVMFIKMVLFK